MRDGETNGERGDVTGHQPAATSGWRGFRLLVPLVLPGRSDPVDLARAEPAS